MATIKKSISTPSLSTLQSQAEKFYGRDGNAFTPLRLSRLDLSLVEWKERPSDQGKAAAAFLRCINACSSVGLTGDTLLEVASQQLRLETLKYDAALKQ